MKPLSLRQSLKLIRQSLNAVSKSTLKQDNILIGITGYVASGKSRLCDLLKNEFSVLLQRPVLFLPFDLWIDIHNLYSSSNYSGRFLLEDLKEAVKCILLGKEFFVPRYDIMKTITERRDKNTIYPKEFKFDWNNRTFFPFSCPLIHKNLPGSIGLYIEPNKDYIYSFFPKSSNTTFIIDGTLVFPDEIKNCYHVKIFVQASWPLRLARMVRRFNRNEIFGKTQKSLTKEIGFLVEEAKTCADEEIRQQLTDDMIVVESTPDTLSNYLDLSYLKWLVSQPTTPQWITIDEIEKAMDDYIQNLKKECDPEIIEAKRKELLALTESKHLFILKDAGKLISDLSEALMS